MDDSYQQPLTYHYNTASSSVYLNDNRYSSAFNPIIGGGAVEGFHRRPPFYNTYNNQSSLLSYDVYSQNYQYQTTATTAVPSANRSRSVGPTSVLDNFNGTMNPQRKAFTTLQRQHRSLDGMELVGDYENNDWQMPPLNVSTSVSSTNPQQLISGPLSNPTNSNSYFWKQPIYLIPPTKTDAFYASSSTESQFQREYEILKKEYENAMQKLNSTMNSIKSFWSPELKRERQLRKEESSKLASLQRQIAMRNISGTSSMAELDDLKRELEDCQYELMQKEEMIRCCMESNELGRDPGVIGPRFAELEKRCNQLESLLNIRDQQIRSMEQQITQLSSFQSTESAKDRHIATLEEEISRLRLNQKDKPRDFTDKSISSQELNTFRLKLERSEVELAQKCTELSSVQARLQSALDENEELRKHLGVLRQSASVKEKHSSLLQSDIEALRAKLEAKNNQLEQKDKICDRLNKDLKQTKDQVVDMRETNKSLEQRQSQLIARLDGIEKMLREKESELDETKQKLLSLPDAQQERFMKLQIEEANRDKIRMQSLMDEIRRNAEKEKSEQLETFKEKNKQLSSTIESLQKELADRQILLESQNEKIGDLDRQLCSLASKNDRNQSQSIDEQILEARKEIDSLLRMVQNLEKEKSSLVSQCKQLQGKLGENTKDGAVCLSFDHHRIDLPKICSSDDALKNRVEELEEALRESVSITAEREVHVAQQKQINQQLIMQLSEARHELNELRKHLKDLTAVDKDEMMRCFEVERRQHLEQLLQFKHEALVAAIAEKDAHIALLEQSRDKPRDEIETLRHHKEKLMEKLKEENERRAQLLSSSTVNIAIGGPVQQSSSTTALHSAPTRGTPIGTASSLSVPPAVAAHLSHLSTISSVDQDDDAEGIWA